MLGRGWQWVEETGNRARAGEYSTEEKRGMGVGEEELMGSSQAIKSPMLQVEQCRRTGACVNKKAPEMRFGGSTFHGSTVK